MINERIARARLWFRTLDEERRARPTEFWQRALFVSFWINIALFPVGYGFREVAPPVCLIFLLLYYRYGWEESVLRRLRVWWLFLFAAAFVAVGVVFSIHPWDSFLHAAMGVNKSYILPFVAMECVKSEKQLKDLVWAFVCACFWEGLDGLWQLYTGRDFVMGYAPNAGRLTGSLGDYTVGNYIALALPPAFGVWFALRRALPALWAALVFCALFWPAWILLAGASSRSGLLAVAGAVFLWQALARGLANWRAWIYPALIFALFALCRPGRLSLAAAAGDNRWDLWSLAWKVFLEHPFFGAGAGQYNAAFREMGLAPRREAITISHPHNLYLDMLYAHGAIGFCLGMIFICGFLLWTIRKIYPNLKAELGERDKIYWKLTTWIWLGYAAWFVNGVFGHDFYRIWWLAEAMCAMGVVVGAVVYGERKNFSRAQG